ncbi:hypothetical protein EB118_06140 [bacterium]|nr:hypothetical protein [bacterium]
MTFKISDFRTALGSGSRPNLFQIKVTLPNSYAVTGFEYVCRAASLPSATVGLIEIATAGGRKLKMGGDRQFPEWTTTVLNDENFIIRSRFEKWQNDIVKTNYNLTAIGQRTVGVGTLLTGVVEIYQLDVDGKSVKNGECKLINCWPSDISSIDLSYDTTDAVEEFTITWAYDYYILSSNAVLS